MSLFDLKQAYSWISHCRILGKTTGSVESVEIDSRKVVSGTLFVALPGEKVDGHDYVEKALSGGAEAVLVSEEWAEKQVEKPGSDKTWIVVESPLKALQQLAKGYLKLFPDLVRLAVTGSNGKTTTKEIAGCILKAAGSSIYSVGNFNSDIGLPLMVFRVRPNNKWALFEMGMNRKGEIAELVDIVRPQRALITNIGTAHIGMLGSREALAEEKKSIFSRFDGNQTGIVWQDDPYRDFLLKDLKGKALTFGVQSLEGFLGVDDLGLDGQLLRFKQGNIKLHWWGSYNLLNCLAAITLTGDLGISWQTQKAGIEASKPLFGRSEVIKGAVTLVRDCYNANPESMVRSLEALEQLQFPGRKILVLGDMGELGDLSSRGHLEVLEKALKVAPDRLYTLGEQMLEAGKAVSGDIRGFADLDKLSCDLQSQVQEGDLVWLKGSRSLEMERLTEPLMNP